MMTDIDCKDEAPIKIPYWYFYKIENKVVECLIEAGIKKYPIDPFEIVKNLKIQIMAYNDRKCVIEGYSQGGLTRERSIILYNRRCGKNAIRFTILHELGHIVLGHKGESDLAERLANHFAGYAIAPPPVIDRIDCKTIKVIMSAFKVSEQCAEFRLKYYERWKNHRIKNYEIKLLRHLGYEI